LKFDKNDPTLILPAKAIVDHEYEETPFGVITKYKLDLFSFPTTATFKNNDNWITSDEAKTKYKKLLNKYHQKISETDTSEDSNKPTEYLTISRQKSANLWKHQLLPKARRTSFND
jgi:hypothetical protein